MELLLRVASPLGLYAEEFDTSTGRHLENFPQAFSHLADRGGVAHHPRGAPCGALLGAARDAIGRSLACGG
jgi:hypothetical protein